MSVDLSQFSIDDLKAMMDNRHADMSIDGLKMLEGMMPDDSPAKAQKPFYQDAVNFLRPATDLINPEVAKQVVKYGMTQIAASKGIADSVLGLAQIPAQATDVTKNAVQSAITGLNTAEDRLIEESGASRNEAKVAELIGGAVLPIRAGKAIAGKVQPAIDAMSSTTKRGLSNLALGATQGLAAGAMQPIQDTSHGYAGPKLEQAGVSAGLGGALSGLFSLGGTAYRGGKHLYNDVRDMFSKEGQLNKLHAFERELLLDDPARVQAAAQAVRDVKPIVQGSVPTITDALEGMPGATGLISHVERVAGGKASSPLAQEASDLRVQAQQESLNEFTANEGRIQGDKAVRDTVTGAQREKVFAQTAERRKQYDQKERLADRRDVAEQLLVAEEQRIAGEAAAGARQAARANKRIDVLTPKPVSDIPATAVTPPNALRTAQEIAKEEMLAQKYGQPKQPLQTAAQIAETKALQSEAVEGVARQREAEAKLVGASQASGEAAIKAEKARIALGKIKPLSVVDIVKQIDVLLKDKRTIGLKHATDALKDVRKHMFTMADEKGFADVVSLDAFRKDGLRKHLLAYTEGLGGQAKADLMRVVRNTLDEAIERGGGTGWKAYNKQYGEMSAATDRLQAGLDLQTALKRQGQEGLAQIASRYEKVLQDIESGTLSKDELAKAENVLFDIQRTLRGRALGEQTKDVKEISGKASFDVPSHFLTSKGYWANFVLKTMGKRAMAASEKLAYELHADKGKWADFIEKGRPDKQWKITELLSGAIPTKGTVAGVVGETSGQREKPAIIQRPTPLRQRVTEAMMQQPPQMAQEESPTPKKVDRSFEAIMPVVFGIEGTTPVEDDGGSGFTLDGINANANNMTQEQVEAMTHEQKANLYRVRYWDKIGADQLPDNIRAQAFDASVNQGTKATMKLLEKVKREDGSYDAKEFVKLRIQRYEGTLESERYRDLPDSKKQEYFTSWMNRIKLMERFT